MAGFHKRTYDAATLARDTVIMTARLPALLDAYRSQRIPWAFAEKIMLAVTSVNECRYCAWFHSDLALNAGADDEQVQMITKGVIGDDVSDYERPALLYAINYAESNRDPEPARRQELVDFYGPEIAADIDVYIHAIFMGNLTGNTFDLMLETLKLDPDGPVSQAVRGLLASVARAPALLFPQAVTNS